MRSGIASAERHWPGGRITVNLAPASLRKEGSGFDLPIALAILAASGQVSSDLLALHASLGELSLDGRIRPVGGALAVAEGARRSGLERMLCAPQSAAEVALAGIEPVPVRHLAEAAGYLAGEVELPAWEPDGEEAPAPAPFAPDLTDVRGQERARRALELAAAGGHNLLLAGPPGTGKTMLARRLPGILPPLADGEVLEVTRIHSVAGLLAADRPVVLARPFRAPHHSASTAAIVGGGPGPRPGEASLAHRGVLLLDELPEFQRPALEALRQPLEDGFVSVARVGGRALFPARFQLVGTMNLCPCGGRGDPRRLHLLAAAPRRVPRQALPSAARPFRPRRRRPAGARRGAGGRACRGVGAGAGQGGGGAGAPGRAAAPADTRGRRVARPRRRAPPALGARPGAGGAGRADGRGARGRRVRRAGARGRGAVVPLAARAGGP